ncbi:TAXI family TRAP transporter solute-binding subunit [Allokutzneria oryzae]|uniref:TAXI family TRAP transporter solute-binding subunit n=1 Tax=Allokutzneria oryzae TaxID=1378989 RepID=A0ABV5ZSP3_9PSEU
MTSGVRRRSVLLGGVLGVLAAGCSTTGYRGEARGLGIAAGEPGGPYLAFAERLAEQIRQAQPLLRATALTTQASVANLALLAARGTDLALTHADAAEAAMAGRAPFSDATPLRALGRIYENYLQVVVRADSPLQRVADLRGRAVSMGAPGSGAALLANRLAAVAGLRDTDLRSRQLRLADAVAALERREIDALVWSGGVPTPAIGELDERVGVRLLPLDDVYPGLRAAHGTVYEQVSVPAGAYRLVRGVPTVGVANLVVCLPELPDDVAAEVTTVLAERADRLVPQEALGTQFLDVRTLTGTAAIPLHPGAAAVYRRLHG